VTGGSVPEPRWRLRISYKKTGRPSYISHLDFVRLFERAARRAGLPLAFSGGYSPAPRIAYGWPLPVGMPGLAEYADIELTERVDPEAAAESLNRAFPEGIRVRDARYVSPHGASLMAELNAAAYVLRIPSLGRSLDQWREAASEVMARDRLEVVRERAGEPGGARSGRSSAGGKVMRKTVDVRPLILRVEVREVAPDGKVVVFTELSLGDKGVGRPQEVAALLQTALCKSCPLETVRDDEPDPMPGLEGLEIVRLGLRKV